MIKIPLAARGILRLGTRLHWFVLYLFILFIYVFIYKIRPEVGGHTIEP